MVHGYNDLKEASSGNYCLPVLMAARNEEILIKKALGSIIRSILNYKMTTGSQINEDKFNLLKDNPFYIVICDNNSRDSTTQKIAEFKQESQAVLQENNIHIITIEENIQGKVYALKALMNYIENQLSIQYDNVIFTDADVEWEPNVYYELNYFKHKIQILSSLELD